MYPVEKSLFRTSSKFLPKESDMKKLFSRKASALFVGFALLGITLLSVAPTGADEGMWLFNGLPKEHLKEKYGFEPTEAWAKKLMRASVRFNSGGSGSFISSDGLVLTNHHVAEETLHKLSTEGQNLYKDGFLAKSKLAELKAPDLELNQLNSIEDVTERVNSSVTDGMSIQDAAAARRKAIATIEKASKEATGLRSNVITLFGGGRYHLYRYKQYTDVRLVFSPEVAIAFFGGDADNFEYPRWCLDCCIFRVYEDGKPAKTPDFLKWSKNGPKKDELVFVSGNPGRTSRIFTMDALRYQRDVQLPYVLDFLRRREILLQQFSLRGPEQARQARAEQSGIQNARKAYMGMLGGLQDPSTMAMKQLRENEIRKAIASDPKLSKYASAFKAIAEVQKERMKDHGKGLSLNVGLFNTAQTIVQLVHEDQKPNEKRLPKYRQSGRQSLELSLFSSAPVHPELEQTILGDLIARMCEKRGCDDPVCKTLLAGKNPIERADELIAGCTLMDVDARKALVEGGVDAVKSSKDPMIQLALALDDQFRAQDESTNQLAEKERQAYAKIAEVLFKTQADSTYPDATFSLRLAFGTVKGYKEGGKEIAPMTDIKGTFQHEKDHEGEKGFQLPKTWKTKGQNMPQDTPFNFVCTADIIGGNSGSPVVNKDLELVGLIFDGNIQSLTSRYMYTDKQARSVSVHSSAIRNALRYIYDASDLAEQLGK